MWLTVSTGFCQSMKINITTPGDSINLSGDSDNNNTLFNIKPAGNSTMAYLIINISNDNKGKNWGRRFYINDESNNPVINELKQMKENEYCITIKEITAKLKKNKTYRLYTIILPWDKTKAMMVKIAPLLVCKLKVVDN